MAPKANADVSDYTLLAEQSRMTLEHGQAVSATVGTTPINGVSRAPDGSSESREPAKNQLTRSEKRRRRIRREYNRRYMRSWRSPQNQTLLKRRKCREAASQKKRRKRLKRKPGAQQTAAGNLCGFCKKRPAVCTVTRFRAIPESNSSLQPIRVPYCGVC